jgi:hypothetical protein
MERNKVYEEMNVLRGRDIYPDDDLETYLVEKIFPDTVETLALKLSNVTAGFYGFALKHAGLECGFDKLDPISKSLFRELGRLKTMEAREKGIDLPKDTRALAMVFITAVFTSSPEYRFEFLKFTPQETVVRIFGACRYYRIAKKLNIESYLTWPVLTPFFEGIAEEVGAKCVITVDIRALEEDGTCDYIAKFAMNE